MTRELPPGRDGIARYDYADGTLTVKRETEANKKLIEARGSDRDGDWTRRVPATRTSVEVGDHLWSIPDNWRQCYHRTIGDTTNDRIYHITESGEFVLTTLPDEDSYLVEAHHTVETIGSITWTARADIDQDALGDALDHVEEHSEEFDDAVRDVLEYARDNPIDATDETEEVVKIHKLEHLENTRQIVESAFGSFNGPFRSEDGIVTHPEHERESEVIVQVHDLLNDFAVVPESPHIFVTVR